MGGASFFSFFLIHYKYVGYLFCFIGFVAVVPVHKNVTQFTLLLTQNLSTNRMCLNDILKIVKYRYKYYIFISYIYNPASYMLP